MRYVHRMVKSTCAGILVLALAGSARGAVLWDESLQGDFSNDNLNPTHLVLSTGANTIIGTTGTDDEGVTDLDYIRVDLPAGRKLTGLILQQYISNDPLAFIGMEKGPVFTFTPDQAFAHFSDLYGWTHFGSGEDDNPPPGIDILPRMGSNAATPVTPPFVAPNFTFWIQQLGVSTAYQFDFIESAPVLGDLNLDGALTSADVPALLGALTDLNGFKSTNSLSAADLLAIGDINGDGVVNNADLQSLLEKLKSGAGSLSAVPEPSTLLLSITCVGTALSIFGGRKLRHAVPQRR